MSKLWAWSNTLNTAYVIYALQKQSLGHMKNVKVQINLRIILLNKVSLTKQQTVKLTDKTVEADLELSCLHFPKAFLINMSHIPRNLRYSWLLSHHIIIFHILRNKLLVQD